MKDVITPPPIHNISILIAGLLKMLFLLKIKERYFLVLHVAVALLWVTK